MDGREIGGLGVGSVVVGVSVVVVGGGVGVGSCVVSVEVSAVGLSCSVSGVVVGVVSAAGGYVEDEGKRWAASSSVR